MKLKGVNSLIHIYHLRKTSESDWSIESTVDPKWYPQEDKKGDGSRGRQLTQESRPGQQDLSH